MGGAFFGLGHPPVHSQQPAAVVEVFGDLGVGGWCGCIRAGGAHRVGDVQATRGRKVLIVFCLAIVPREVWQLVRPLGLAHGGAVPKGLAEWQPRQEGEELRARTRLRAIAMQHSVWHKERQCEQTLARFCSQKSSMMAAARACGSVLRSRRTQRRLVAGSKAAVQLQSGI